MLNLVFLFFPDLPIWLESIEQPGYVAHARHSFSYPALCQKSLVTPDLGDNVALSDEELLINHTVTCSHQIMLVHNTK